MKFALGFYILSCKLKSICLRAQSRLIYQFAKSSQAGSRVKALELCVFSKEDQRPVLLILGGSLGSVFLNNLVLKSLDQLLLKISSDSYDRQR